MCDFSDELNRRLFIPAIIKYEGNNKVVSVTPDLPDYLSLFYVSVYYPNLQHVTFSYHSQRFGKNFIQSLGKATNDQKHKFVEICNFLIEQGFTFFLKINNKCFSLDSDIIENPIWEEDWHGFEFQSTGRIEQENQAGIVIKCLPYFYNAILCLAFKEEELFSDIEARTEGNCIHVELDKYERSRINRQLCIDYYGYKCQVCGFDFREKYGDIGEGFIEVHHINPVSTIGQDYQIDPRKDLIPVCSNCHSMLHRTNPPLMPEDLKKKILDNK